MIDRLKIRKQREKKMIFLNTSALKLLSTNEKKTNRLTELFFPTRSRIKLHQTHSLTNSPLNQQVAKLNQRAVSVQHGIERSISSLQTQRLQNLTILNDKTRDLERAAATFEYSSSKHLKQELDKTKKLTYIFKISIFLCLTLFSFMAGYMIIQVIRDKRTI